MKYFVIVFYFVSMCVKGQSAYFGSAGITFSNVIASSDITSMRVHSDYKTGFWIGWGKAYEVTRKLFWQPQLKILKTGGYIRISSLLQYPKIPNDIRKYGGTEFNLTLYQSELEMNWVYKTAMIYWFAGVQPSLIFYGDMKDNKPHEVSPPIFEQKSQNVEKTHTYLTIRANYGLSLRIHASWEANIGYHFNITNPVAIHYQDIKITFSQNVFQMGVSYFISSNSDR